jgi:hypothetical protein
VVEFNDVWIEASVRESASEQAKWGYRRIIFQILSDGSVFNAVYECIHVVPNLICLSLNRNYCGLDKVNARDVLWL